MSSQTLAAILAAVRREQPLVHLINNEVTMGDVAHALRAFGARPVMAYAREEVAEITAQARALVLNLGTPTTERIAALALAGQAANEWNIPVVFDPVGVGASQFRLGHALKLLSSLNIAVLRGNAGEMAVLTGRMGSTSGIDSAASEMAGTDDRAELAYTAAMRWHTVAAVTGPHDYVSNGTETVIVANGHPLLPTLTGTGDMVSALVGACLAVEADALAAAVCALACLSLAGERAAAAKPGPGTFRTALLDELAQLDGARLEQEVCLEGVS